MGDLPRDFLRDPRSALDVGAAAADSAASAGFDDLRLQVARRRFTDAVERIAMVRRASQLAGTSSIEHVDDLVPLLYTQETFKSYPQSWLEAGDFRRLTKWLSTLTAADLGGVDTSGCELIEDWMAALKGQSAVDLQISAGADGKSAFLPRSRDEWSFLHRAQLSGMVPADDTAAAQAGPRPGVDAVPLIYLGARRGARSLSRFLDFYEDTFGAGLVDTLTEYADSDLLSLAGRIRDASRKGEAGTLQINPRLLARKEEIARLNAENAARADALTDRLIHDYRGRRIICQGTMQKVHELALRFRDMGVQGAYAPGSVFLCGSGFSDGVEPPGWERETATALGVSVTDIRIGYSMQEALWVMRLCDHRKFHLPATLIPYVLDESSGAPLPRTGRQAGRFAFFDLAADASWGGYITGDHVTINWDQRCGCGRESRFLDSPISRIAVGQHDKISCAGTASAVDEATEFFLRS